MSASYKIILILLTLNAKVWAGNDMDSLRLVIKDATQDTTRVNACIDLAGLFLNSNPDSSIFYVRKALAISNSCHWHKGISDAYGWLGYLYAQRGEINNSIRYSQLGLNMARYIGDLNKEASLLNNIAAMYEKQGRTREALFHYEKSIQIFEKLGYKPGIAFTLFNMGYIHESQEDNEQAMKNYQRSLKLQEEAGNIEGEALANNGIGILYKKQKNYVEAITYLNRALELFEKSGNKSRVALIKTNVGVVLLNMGDTLNAEKNFTESLKAQRELKNQEGIAIALAQLAQLHLMKNDLNAAWKEAEEALRITTYLKIPLEIRRAAEVHYRVAKKMRKFDEAYASFALYRQMNDSLVNLANKTASIRSQLKYEFERKAIADSVKVVEERTIINNKLEKEKTIRNGLRIGLFGLIAIVIFILINLNKSRRANQEISIKKRIAEEQRALVSKQKTIIEEKQKEILDSIHYAKRIQIALITSERNFGNLLKRCKQ